MAAYQIFQHDVFQVNIFYEMFNQILMNTFHYEYVDAAVIPDGPAMVYALANTFASDASGYLNLSLGYQSDELECTKITAQRIYPQRYRAETVLAAVAGSIDHTMDPSLPQNVAVSLERFTAAAYRGAAGRVQAPGLTQSQVESGQLTGAAIFNWSLVLPSLSKTYTPIGTSHFAPVLFRSRGTPPTTNAVIGATVQETSRVMRRRTVRVGK